MPTSSCAEYVASLLAEGAFRLGEIQVTPDFSLSHREDAGKDDLEVSTDPWKALEIARYDDGGRYRALKTAANLRHGWRLQLADSSEVLTALDFFYPAAIGMMVAHQAGNLTATPLRVTLERQSGMYAVVRKLNGEQAVAVVSRLCCGAVPCLRRKIWSLTCDGPPLESVTRNTPGQREVPLLCSEACNLFVAAGRHVVKGDPAPAGE
ncbi:MAG: hypothetical protein BGO12_16705 [Verrucomicrobia bacterium 61-8]|nr:hypothetical protein [Verrucomicrobiota bacterium]OJV04055.1 MAG: hypothetical protein BGO12_16705 [Verrucomicrobia bacterium 61-8]